MNDMPVQTIEVQDVNMAYLDSGAGRPLIFIHGNYSSRRWFLNQLHDPLEGWRYLAPDMPNFGLSDPLPVDISIEAYAGYVLAFADAVGLHPFALPGPGAGGPVARHIPVQPPGRA